MATLTIRDLELLEAPAPTGDLASRIRARFAVLGDVELPIAEREPMRAPPSFDEGSRAARRPVSKHPPTKRRA